MIGKISLFQGKVTPPENSRVGTPPLKILGGGVTPPTPPLGAVQTNTPPSDPPLTEYLETNILYLRPCFNCEDHLWHYLLV